MNSSERKYLRSGFPRFLKHSDESWEEAEQRLEQRQQKILELMSQKCPDQISPIEEQKLSQWEEAYRTTLPGELKEVLTQVGPWLVDFPLPKKNPGKWCWKQGLFLDTTQLWTHDQRELKIQEEIIPRIHEALLPKYSLEAIRTDFVPSIRTDVPLWGSLVIGKVSGSFTESEGYLDIHLICSGPHYGEIWVAQSTSVGHFIYPYAQAQGKDGQTDLWGYLEDRLTHSELGLDESLQVNADEKLEEHYHQLYLRANLPVEEKEEDETWFTAYGRHQYQPLPDLTDNYLEEIALPENLISQLETLLDD